MLTVVLFVLPSTINCVFAGNVFVLLYSSVCVCVLFVLITVLGEFQQEKWSIRKAIVVKSRPAGIMKLAPILIPRTLFERYFET